MHKEKELFRKTVDTKKIDTRAHVAYNITRVFINGEVEVKINSQMIGLNYKLPTNLTINIERSTVVIVECSKWHYPELRPMHNNRKI